MAYDVRNERFILLNKILYKCMSCHYKTLLSLCNCEVEQDNLSPVLVSDCHPQATRFVRGEGHFYCVINMSSTTLRFICIFIQKCKNINSAVKTNKERVNESGNYVQTLKNSIFVQ